MNRSGSVRNFARSSRHGKRDLTRGDAGPPPPARAAVAWEEDGRGCLFGNRGAVAGSRRPARVSSRPRLPSPQGLTARGLPFGTRVRRLLGCSHASARRSHASGERMLPGCSRQCRRVGPEVVTGCGRAAFVRTSLPHHRPPTSGLRSGRRPPSRQVLDPNVPSGTAAHNHRHAFAMRG